MPQHKRRMCPRDNCDGVMRRDINVGKHYIGIRFCELFRCPNCGAIRIVPVVGYKSPSQDKMRKQAEDRQAKHWLTKPGAREV